jgi:hypothetical protein
MGQKGLTFINGQKKFGVRPKFYINIYIGWRPRHPCYGQGQKIRDISRMTECR